MSTSVVSKTASPMASGPGWKSPRMSGTRPGWLGVSWMLVRLVLVNQRNEGSWLHFGSEVFTCASVSGSQMLPGSVVPDSWRSPRHQRTCTQMCTSLAKLWTSSTLTKADTKPQTPTTQVITEGSWSATMGIPRKSATIWSSFQAALHPRVVQGLWCFKSFWMFLV